MLGSLVLSGTQAIALSYDDYIYEYPIVGKEGGIVQWLGAMVTKVRMHGFFQSGADAQKDLLLSFRGTEQNITIPSHLSGYFWASGSVYVERVFVTPVAGRQDLFYEWSVEAKAVGRQASGSAGDYGGIIFGGYTIYRYRLDAINYSQVLPIFASIHPDYSQVLPIGVSEHPDYSQVLPLGVSIHANYVRIS